MQFNTDTGDLESNPEAPQREPVVERPVFTDQAALEQTKKLMHFRDFAQSRLLAWGAGDIANHLTFKLEGWEFDMLVDAYSGLVQKMGKLPPWFDILLAESVVMGPKFAKLIKLRQLEAKVSHLEAENSQFRRKQMEEQVMAQAAATGQRMHRRDGQRMWKVDNRGFFEYDTNRNYLKVKDRFERPDPDQDWERLSKWNDSELLKVAFNR